MSDIIFDAMITPHGGKLINKVLSYNKSKYYYKNLEKYPKIYASTERIKDIKNISLGVYSPLTGFLYKKDYRNVLKHMRLANGIVWTIPIVLDISETDKKRISDNERVIVYSKETKHPVAVLTKPEIYTYSKEELAKYVFGTTDKKHPGVEEVLKMKKYLLGGETFLMETNEMIFPEHNMSPEQTRKIFLNRGWKTIGAFQTRNIPHKGHEYLQRETLKQTDGLFIQPVIGEKKIEDFKDEYIIGSYEILIDKYLPQGKVVLGILPVEMRYAGPREAVFHAIIRKNYGCTHFIVGRDHAGVGDFYEPSAAHEIFDQFDPKEIGIKILKYPEVVYDKRNKRHCFFDDCHEDNRVRFSGTSLRTLIKNKDIPQEYLIAPEVFKLIINSDNALVDELYKSNRNNEGFVLWFTGLPQSGKSTIADIVYDKLKDAELKIERLDGDIVRESLTKDLGFTKQDRDENIRRVGFVAKLLARNGVGVIASFISPYKSQRDSIRLKTPNFIEVFVNTPLKICEEWDKKGYYKKAREGKIKDFTGISAPYEKPEIPEIELRPDLEGIEKSAERVLSFLKKRNYILSKV
ncbi:sulfate adenylyltransferase [Patescibacteria group bacterium]|nr:sulfate adenylyltransferase [Patescibacteria group bacterium]